MISCPHLNVSPRFYCAWRLVTHFCSSGSCKYVIFMWFLVVCCVQNRHENRIHPYNHKVNYKQKTESILTTTSDVSPSGDPAGCPCIKGAAWCCQTHWFDIVSEFNRWGQLQQGYVVVVCLGIIVRVVDDLGHGAGLFIRVQRLLGFTSEIHNKAGCAGAGKQWKILETESP